MVRVLPGGQRGLLQLRLQRRQDRRHRLGVPGVLLPGGGFGGPHLHDPPGGGGAPADRHLKGPGLLPGGHRFQIYDLRRHRHRRRVRGGGGRGDAGVPHHHHQRLRHHVRHPPHPHPGELAGGGPGLRGGPGGHPGAHPQRLLVRPAGGPRQAHAAQGPQGRQAHPVRAGHPPCGSG